MTALYMGVGGNGVFMLSDGIAYDEQGIVRQVHQKQLVRPDLSLVASASGTGPVLEFVRFWLAQHDPQSFDAFHDAIGAMMRHVIAEMALVWPEKQNYATLLYGGWSDRASKFVGFIVGTYSTKWISAFQPLAIDAFGKPDASAEMIERHDLGEGAYERHGIANYGHRFMLAARGSPAEMHEPGSAAGYIVGGFVEQTFLQRECADARIAWRWPDEIGRVADPTRDPPDHELAPWLFKVAHGAQDQHDDPAHTAATGLDEAVTA